MCKFNGLLEKYEDKIYNYHIKVPADIVDKLKRENIKRFICYINSGEPFHSSLIPAGNRQFFIKINKELRDHYGLNVGSEVTIEIAQDKSPYGMPMPSELEELLILDPEGDRYFHTLPPGKQRNLLFMVNKLKSTDKRIEKSLIILEHLKEQLGNLDFKILHQDFKNKKGL